MCYPCCRRFPQQYIRSILNPDYATTNNAYSLLLARRFLEDKHSRSHYCLLLLDSDILFSSKLLSFFLDEGAKDKISVRRSGEHNNEEEIHVNVDAKKNIILIEKGKPNAETYGESIGIEVFSA
jgi:choline kinase